jgi:NAD(P)-dependent dehydrogenase (short-subunit alcohol dehydrogenase family)
MNILITGTSSGIGFGLAIEYLQRGDEVWGISRRFNEALATKERYHHLQTDLTDFDTLEPSLKVFLGSINHFDLVVLNSGVLGDIRLMKEIGVEPMKKVLEINVWANKVLLDLLFSFGVAVKQVVGMSSKASFRSTPGWGPYSLSKAGLNMLMNIYAKEYPATHFISFAPGLVDSEIQDHIYHIAETEKYPTTKKMQEARYTELMPDPLTAAPKLIEGIQKALNYESGSFVDVREM